METKEYAHIYREANWAGYPVILVGILIILLGLYGSANGKGSVGATVIFWLIGGLVVWQGKKIVVRKQPLFQFGPSGLWTPKIGFMPWEDVRVSIVSVSGFGIGVIKSLVIIQRQSRRQLDVVALMSLGISEETLIPLIQKYIKIDPPQE
ncbi:hypothetical protein [Hymenobacter sp. UYP22]|uniref:hypothetical protein n=1 Tax=Hymenobacter sp. UYP22 TaxID=3156348 RepID=UPI0033924A01